MSCWERNNARVNRKTLKQFDSKPRVWDNFECFGTQIKTLALSLFSIGQELYAKQLHVVLSDSSFAMFALFVLSLHGSDIPDLVWPAP